MPDHNHPHATGVGPIASNNPNGIRWSTALGYLNPARHRLNLTVRANTHVCRLIFKGKRVVGVEAESGGERFVVEAEEIILSSGTIGSAHTLLLSGVGPAEQLEQFDIPQVHELPGVGKNLRDHPFIYTTWRTRPEHPLDGLAPRTQLFLRWTAEGSHLWNDLLIIMQSFATERVNRGGDRMTPIGIRMSGSLYLAVSVGELTLQSADPRVQPLLEYRYLRDEFDRKRMREIVRTAVKLGEHPDFALDHPRPDRADRRRACQRRGAGRVPAARGLDRAAHRRDLQDGAGLGPDGGGGPVRQGPRPGGLAGGRRLDHPGLPPREHQRLDHDDRRADRRLHPHGPLTRRGRRTRKVPHASA